MFTPVTVIRDGRVRAAGHRDSDAIVYDEGDVVHVFDHWIDVIVGPPEHPYRVLDLDEYADAIAGGVIDAAAGVDGLRRTQRFLDRHLNRRHDTRRDAWPDFPPRAIAGLAELPFRPQWEAVGR